MSSDKAFDEVPDADMRPEADYFDDEHRQDQEFLMIANIRD
jgi:hypothetical protein